MRVRSNRMCFRKLPRIDRGTPLRCLGSTKRPKSYIFGGCGFPDPDLYHPLSSADVSGRGRLGDPRVPSYDARSAPPRRDGRSAEAGARRLNQAPAQPHPYPRPCGLREDVQRRLLWMPSPMASATSSVLSRSPFGKSTVRAAMKQGRALITKPIIYLR